jgi:UDP-N-acetylglucosamine 2-epimerase (non-hydrolysing)
MAASPQHRVLVVVGTRPEAVKLAPVVHALQQAPWAEARVLATAQHRQLLDQIHAFFGITPDRDLDLMRPDQTLADLTARMIAAMDPVLAAERPALVLAQGDTTTVMVTALCCFYRKIPFGHVEAGLRTGDVHNPFPEEMNRVLVGRMAALHFAPTEGSAQNLLREGVPAASVQVTGNTVIDALLWAAERVDPARSRRRRANGSCWSRRTAARTSASRSSRSAAPCASSPTGPTCSCSTPCTRTRTCATSAHRVLGRHPSIRLVDPLDYPDMVAAMRACDLILTDSGGVQEEAPSLGKPVLVLRTTTERPEGVAAGAAKLVGTDRNRIVAEASRLLDDSKAYQAMASVQNPYGDGRAARRIVQAIGAHLGVDGEAPAG